MDSAERYDKEEEIAKKLREILRGIYIPEFNLVKIEVDMVGPGTFDIVPNGHFGVRLYFWTEAEKSAFEDSVRENEFQEFCKAKFFELDEWKIFPENVKITFGCDSDERIQKEDDGDYFKGLR